MTNTWSLFPKEMLAAKAASETFRDGLDQEQRQRFDEAVRQYLGEPEDGGRIAREIQRLTEDELAIRRSWAMRIREEFGKYHEHPTGGSECGACGAIQAANWMDPDYLTDGPQAEPFGSRRNRHP